jgi:hypothetical protein
VLVKGQLVVLLERSVDFLAHQRDLPVVQLTRAPGPTAFDIKFVG